MRVNSLMTVMTLTINITKSATTGSGPIMTAIAILTTSVKAMSNTITYLSRMKSMIITNKLQIKVIKVKTMNQSKKVIVKLSLTGAMRILRQIRMRMNISVILILKLSWRPTIGTSPKDVVTQKTDDTMMIMMSNTCLLKCKDKSTMMMTERSTITITSDPTIITTMSSEEDIITPILRLRRSDSSRTIGRRRVPSSRDAVSDDSVKKSWMTPMKPWPPT